MHALPDPADPDQAVLDNVTFFVDGLNHGPDRARRGTALRQRPPGPRPGGGRLEAILWFEERGTDPDGDITGIGEFFEIEVGPLP